MAIFKQIGSSGITHMDYLFLTVIINNNYNKNNDTNMQQTVGSLKVNEAANDFSGS